MESELDHAMAFHRTTGLIVGASAAIFLAVLIFVIPALINVDRYRPQVIAYLQQKTGKQVEIGRLSLSFSPLSIHVEGFGAKNSSLFPPGYIVKIAKIDAGLDAARRGRGVPEVPEIDVGQRRRHGQEGRQIALPWRFP